MPRNRELTAIAGRPLLPASSRREGVRDDLRSLARLQVHEPQPSGIRVEDAVAWAREILLRYGNWTPPPTALRLED